MTTTADMRETRQFARETKFLIDVELSERIRAWARERMGPDPNGSGSSSDHYSTTSLYFDTDAFDVFRRRGSFGRSKYRIRTYGHYQAIFLERKFRTEQLLAKRRTLVDRADLDRLFASAPDQSWPGYWFHRRLLVRALRPMCQVTYLRTARLATSVAGQMRLTIDDGLRVLPMPDLAFIPGTGLPMLEGQAILELKYRHTLPSLFKHLIADFTLAPRTVSKYRLGITALGFAPADQMEVVS